jgi:peptidoglycan/xylan/chitin deacetylase (PgdA/CDA1 family)
MSFLYKVQAQGGSNAQVIGITNSATATGGIHVWNKGASATTFQLGITRISTTSADIQWINSAFDASLTYLVVVKWDGTKASLFVNPVLDAPTESSPNVFDDGSVNNKATTITTLSHLIMRGNGSNNVYFYIGGIRISSTWTEAVASTAYLPPVSNSLVAPVVGVASNIQARSFTANWTIVDNAIGYSVKVYWGNALVDSTNINGQSVSNALISGLIPNLTYTYKVNARGDGSNYTNSGLSATSAAFTLSTASIPTNNKLKIILKLDDLGVNATSGFASSAAYDFLKQNKIKASMGAIASRLDNTASATLNTYLNATNEIGDTLIEVWNHGYDHSSNTSTGIYEFSGAPYADQKSHFDLATQTVKNLLGIQMHTFGPPYNQTDETTNTVVSEDPNYNVFMFSKLKSSTNGLKYLDNRVNMESATGNPVYSYFLTNYNSYKSSYTDYMILQGHPNYYALNSSTLDQFKLIVQYLIYEGVEFVRPYDYSRYLSLVSPTNLTANPVSSSRIDLSWIDNSVSENNLKIERSTDGVNYTFIGTSSQNSTSYSDTTVPSAGTYYYRVFADCGIKSDPSNVVQVSNLNTNVKQNFNNLSFNLTVNKAAMHIILSGISQIAGSISCDLINLSGESIQNVYTGEVSVGDFQFIIPCNNLIHGIYFCRIKSTSGYIVKKLTI